jgi:hypothetical protein
MDRGPAMHGIVLCLKRDRETLLAVNVGKDLNFSSGIISAFTTAVIRRALS